MNTEGSTGAQRPRPGDPLVSIVTPTLNRAPYLETVLKSVAAQSYPHVEHIVVDGGSTDGSIDILKRFEHRYGIRWISEPDEGIYQAVNKGMRIANGDVLAYLNTDDLYFPYSVEVAVRALTASPEIGMVYGDLVRIESASRYASLLFYPQYGTADLLEGELIAQPTAFWWREVRDRCGEFDESFVLAADMEFWVRVSKYFDLSKVDEILAFEEHHQDRLSSGPAAERRAHDELARIRRMHGLADPDPSKARWLRRARVALAYRSSLTGFLASGRRKHTGPGGPWSGFLAYTATAPHVRVVRWRLILGLVPFLGRPFKASVEIDRRVEQAHD